ncbi:hypothetical protein GCM10009060_17140 [Halorubrum trapanicum]
MSLPSFTYGDLTDRPLYTELGIGRNGADSEPSFGGGLSARVTRQYLKGQLVNATSSKGVSVPTAQSKPDDTPKFVDACRRPPGKNNTGTPYTVEDRGNGQLAWPAVHQSDTMGLPVPERSGSQLTGL